MTSWLAISVIAGALAGIGNAIDRFLLKRQKRVLYDKMVAWWFKLEGTRFPTLHTRMASHAIVLFRAVMPAWRPAWKLLLVAMGGSFLLTSVSALIGLAVETAIGGRTVVYGIPLPFWCLCRELPV